MDNAVALVQAYLRVNGYFTVTEYPVSGGRAGAAVSRLSDIVSTRLCRIARDFA